jgi:hypothetical protein
MSEPNPPSPPEKNRRLSPRRHPKRTTKATGHKGVLGLGPNVVLSVVDLCENGARLVVKVPLEKGQEVEVNLQGQSHARPLKLPAVVVWSVPTADGNYSVGVTFRRRLSYTELQDLSAGS